VNDPDRRRPPEGFDEDAIFADIVAHLNDVGDQPPPAAPASGDDGATDADPAVGSGEDSVEDTPADTAQESEADATGQNPDRGPAHGPRSPINPWPFASPPQVPTRQDPPAGPGAQTWRASELGDEEEHFEPPPVSPLPAGDLQFWGIIAGMCGGPLLLLYLVLFNRGASSYWILAAIAMAVGGFALLVSRMPGQHGDDDDDGARL
jgi:hypothetical protein